jgi:hypothetical protein
MAEIQLLLYDNGELCLTLYLQAMKSRVEVIVTFLALLELIRLTKVSARQIAVLGDIWIYRVTDLGRDEEGDIELAYSEERAPIPETPFLPETEEESPSLEEELENSLEDLGEEQSSENEKEAGS